MGLTDSELLEVIQPWLMDRRWFAGKGHRITRLEVAGRQSLGDGIEHLTIGVEIDGAHFQVYQVPVVLLDEPHAASLIGPAGRGHLHDGLQHEAVMVALLDSASPKAHLQPWSTGVAPSTQWLDAGPAVSGYRVLNVEQSNTSAVYADEVLVKVFRMLTPGVNPDIEVHAGLFEAGSADVGRLRGWINGGWTDPHTGSTVYGHLAMIQEFFAGSIDGWDLAREEVAADRDFSDEARALGEATARVHRDLAVAFGVQQLGRAEIADMVTRLHDRLSVAVELVPALEAMAPALHERLDRVSTLSGLSAQRVHGDYHLGQALRTPRGWRILDFEGEPGGDLESRRVLDHPMRDVAAMQRSFAYAAWQGAGNSPSAQAWQRACDSAFLEGYAAVAGVDPGDHSVLLEAYTVDKAAYEAVYEQRNRPDWIEIPLTALRDLLAQRD